MSTARKYAFNQPSMSPGSRRHCYAAINILWGRMRPDLHSESKEIVRDERLAWITSFLQLARPLSSTTKLTDGQIGLLLGEMRRMSGTKSGTKPKHLTDTNVVQIADYKKSSATNKKSDAEIIHLAGDAQIYTLEKLETYIGWTAEQRENYLKPRFGAGNFRMLQFKQANALMMQMLNIAAHKDLKATGKKTGRAENAKYIPVLKKKLQIGD